MRAIERRPNSKTDCPYVPGRQILLGQRAWAVLFC